ncbi:MAG: imidazole glycerol phosphate synthase subunit HisH [Candidatus Scalindua sp. AMX11]|nr:MAG: imidazole glycerol phosphate synthase subunit HisH [Candidatus Scalindua sp.]NOG82954.1 imidazole glycerol phosphate synthase subunit HisH [Planctomycetota bacterium]RZV68746.1 MAG: imidazole glycerol phosphate synthase subunit HisH [Candidatus Scalindua sp. SCAELEC01]TDE63829.1 MAG: imidazole glycerol phosphate synthase subunit HisH [Candidatus Scalindua sp. AMX11]
MIAIIDYGVGNIKAFSNIYKNLNIAFTVAKSVDDLKDATKIILPGVGSFDHAMQRLHDSGMRERLDKLVFKKKLPVIGICVGMQMLANKSDEGSLPGLGWIDGVVKKFDQSKLEGKMSLPHMGWNTLNIRKESPLLINLEKEPRFYFLHSYYFECTNSCDIVATASCGDEFTCVVNSGNIYGIQCHPEKSHHNGVGLLKNFGEL